jgi:hypothetical protein
MIRIGPRHFSFAELREILSSTRVILVENLTNCHDEHRRVELETSLRMTDATILAVHTEQAKQQGKLVGAPSRSIN